MVSLAEKSNLERLQTKVKMLQRDRQHDDIHSTNVVHFCKIR